MPSPAHKQLRREAIRAELFCGAAAGKCRVGKCNQTTSAQPATMTEFFFLGKTKGPKALFL